MDVNDEIRAVRTRDKEKTTGVISVVGVNTYIIVDSETNINEMVYSEGAELVRTQAVKRCRKCGFLKANEGFEKIEKNKLDEICKKCKRIEVDKITKCEVDVIEQQTKICVQVGKAFITTDRVKNSASIVLDYQLAESMPKEEIARQIAEDFGGRVVVFETQTTMKEI